MPDDKNLSLVDGTYVNADIVAMLEDVLKEAKEGKILAFGLCAVMPDATTFNVFDAGSYPINLLGEMRCLEREVMDHNISGRLHEAGVEY